jgi:hypothetical protein
MYQKFDTEGTFNDFPRSYDQNGSNMDPNNFLGMIALILD